MSYVGDTLFARALRALARAVCRHPQWFIWPQILLFPTSVFVTLRWLQVDMDRDSLVGADKKFHQVYLRLHQEFPHQDEMAVIVQSESMERNRQFVERLAAKLQAETNLFTDVFYKDDLGYLGPKALLFVPAADLQDVRLKLRDQLPFIQQFTRATNLDSFFTLVNKQFRVAKQEKNAQNDALIGALPALQRIIDDATYSLDHAGAPVSPGVNALFGWGAEAQQRIYITYDNGRIYLVVAQPLNADVIPQAVLRMRELINETAVETPGLNIGLTGEQVLDYDEMQQAEHDSILATVVSLFLCSFIFIAAYREIGRPLKAVICLILGLGFTMGFTTVAVGHLNILTVTFAPILIGLAIDFGIHFITRYEEELRRRRTPEQAVETAMIFTGQGIVTGALTTAGAFLAMWLTDFKGIEEMGIISGGGLALCLVPMMTILPILLMRGRQHVVDNEVANRRRQRIEQYWLDHPVWVIAGSAVLCVAAVTQFGKVSFDYNLLDMQSQGLPGVVYERKLLDVGKQSLLSADIIATNIQEAREIEQRVVNLPSVASVDGSDRSGDPLYAILTQNQDAKLRQVRALKEDLRGVDFLPPDTNAVQLHELSRTLWSTMGYLSLSAEYAQKDDPDLAEHLTGLRESIAAFRVAMLSGDPEIPRRLLGYQQALFDDIDDTFNTLKNQDVSGPLGPADLPPFMRSRFVGKSGGFLVDIYPKKDVRDRQNQKEFVNELQQAMQPHPERVTGTPVQLLVYTGQLKDAYQSAAWYALGAIAIMVFLHFRSIPCVLLSLAPVALGAAWTGGIMGACGIQFNPANIMILPLVIGIGVTNGIHILNRFAEERHAGILAKSTGKAVLVSGLTATVGFGSLILSGHQGMRSLGLVMSIGIMACMIAGLTFLPALINLLMKYGWSMEEKKPEPPRHA